MSWPARRSAARWPGTTPTTRVELAAFDAAVTDWELQRGFERLQLPDAENVFVATED